MTDDSNTVTYSRKDNIVASEEVHALIERECPRAYLVTSFDNAHSPKTQLALALAMRRQGYVTESVFDAAHGRRYLCLVYASRAERSMCWDVLTGGSACRAWIV